MCLSLIGTIQPAALAKYVREAVGEGAGADGFMQRLQLMVRPDLPRAWKLVDHEHDPAIVDQAYDLFVRLEQLTPKACDARQATIKGEPHKRPCLSFSPEAQALFDAWPAELEHRLRNPDPEEPRALRQHWAKYRSLLPKIALILYLGEEQKGPISEAVLRKAMRWEKFLASRARRVYASGPTAKTDTARAIIAKLNSGKLKAGFHAQHVYNSGWADTKDKHITMDALELLGLAALRGKPEPQGGPRSVRYFSETGLVKVGNAL
jgi:putative DNA primase/helicase